MARRTPIQIRLGKLRKAKGLRKSQPFTFKTYGTLTKDVEILDMEYGSWSFIGMAMAPDYKPKRKFDFI